jgi:hypothetical protein
MDGIHNKRERIKEMIRQWLNIAFFPFAAGDLVFDIAKYIGDKIRRKSAR